jgi:hypothetical protein
MLNIGFGVLFKVEMAIGFSLSADLKFLSLKLLNTAF